MKGADFRPDPRFCCSDRPAKPQSNVARVESQKLDYLPKNVQERSAIDAFWSATDPYIYPWMNQMRKAKARLAVH